MNNNDPKQARNWWQLVTGGADYFVEGEKSYPELFMITASEVENEFNKIPGFDYLANEKLFTDAKNEAALVDLLLGKFDLEGANRHAQRYIELINKAWEVS